MTDLRLECVLEADALPPRDPLFRLQVLERRERAAARRQLVMVCATALGAAILVWLDFSFVGTATGQWAVVAAAGGLLTAFLASSYGRLFPTLQGLLWSCQAQALSVLRTMPGLHLWN